MPTVWPPQGSPSFVFKMPCCSCDTGCQSISGVNLDYFCGQNYNVYPPTGSPQPNTYTFNGTQTGSGPPPNVSNWAITFTLSTVDNCDGTTTVTLSGLSVTTTDPTISRIYNVVLAPSTSIDYPPTMVNGDSFVFGGGCGNPDDGGGLNVQWNYDQTGFPGSFTSETANIANSNTFGQSPSDNQLAIEAAFLLTDFASPYPLDATPNCAIGKMERSRCPNKWSFNLFLNTFQFTGLTVGAQYCAQVTYEWQPLAGGAWSFLQTICVQFTASATTDSISRISADPGAILAAAPGGANYRIQPGSPTVVLDPTGSICGAC